MGVSDRYTDQLQLIGIFHAAVEI